ncbi:hypothetical protein HBH96_235310 [Parastagonospora nodorum]|nr:hypothetical protein HBH42_236980 [Parastagonospora nodorum]KAH5046209.1 hypothetical protein HBH96_235310 [Parastagonospora nodorum]KAH5995088.1 hypothetical protein HBI83_241940 [Parastagonospora nodorum]
MLSKQGSNRLSLEELDASTQLIYIYYDFDMIFYDLQMGKRIGGLENGMLHETKSYFHSGCWYHMLQMRAATKRAAFWDAIAPKRALSRCMAGYSILDVLLKQPPHLDEEDMPRRRTPLAVGEGLTYPCTSSMSMYINDDSDTVSHDPPSLPAMSHLGHEDVILDCYGWPL